MKQLLSLFSILLISLALSITTFGQEQTAGDADPPEQGTAGEVKADGGAKVMRIGVLMPKVKLRNAKGEVSAEEALRNSYAVLIDSDLFEVVPLDARLTTLALREAKKKACDYILNIDLSQKKGRSSMFGKVLRDIGNRTSYETSRKVPYGRTAGGRIAGTTARSVIRNTGANMSSMAVQINKNDKFTLEYNMTTATGDAFHKNKITAKAKKNNDDVLTRMLEQSGEDIIKTLIKVLPQ